MTAFVPCWTKLAKAASILRSLPTDKMRGSMPDACAAVCTSLIWDSEVGFPGLVRKPMTLALGTSSRIIPNRLAPSVDDKRHARDVAAGTVETRNETEIDWVGAGRENDRNGRGCSFASQCSRRGKRNDCVHRVRHQIGGQCRQSVEAGIRRAIFDCDIESFDIASVLEAPANRADLSIIQLSAAEQADQRHDRPLGGRRRLPRQRRERPCSRRAAEQCDEVAAFQSITSSARDRIDAYKRPP